MTERHKIHRPKYSMNCAMFESSRRLLVIHERNQNLQSTPDASTKQSTADADACS
jgi:hypothetical protein